MKFSILILFSCIFYSYSLSASDSLEVTKNFKFRDGIFSTISDFQTNKPSYLWKDVKATLVSNPQNYQVQIREIVTLKGDTLDCAKIWGLAVGGIPYLNIDQLSNSKNDLFHFAGFQVRGKICYFDYETTQVRKIKMPVYNPVTGKPFRIGEIERDSVAKHGKLMKFETGEVVDFTAKNLLKWIASDKSLSDSVKEISGANMSEKLFKSLLIFDDRNKVFIKKN